MQYLLRVALFHIGEVFQPPPTEVLLESADARVVDAINDQLNMSTFPDISVNTTDLQGSFLFAELSSLSFERNLTSTPLPSSLADPSNEDPENWLPMGAVESELKSPELSSSKVVQNSQVTLQIEQPMQQLGTFAVLLEAAGLLWQDPTYRQCLQSSKGSICEKISTEHIPQVSVSSCSQYLDIQQFAGQNSPVKLQNLPSDPVRPAEGDRVADLQNKRMIENTVLKRNQSSVAKRSSRQRTNAAKI